MRGERGGVPKGGGGIHGRGMCAWQERRPLQRRVRILLECILVEKNFCSNKGEHSISFQCIILGRFHVFPGCPHIFPMLVNHDGSKTVFTHKENRLSMTTSPKQKKFKIPSKIYPFWSAVQ